MNDAIIAMEDLNFGFKTGRFKVEKQVYQKFENMLISKLNFLMHKQKDPEENGGILHAYQLTNKVTGVNRGRQNGFIFYVPAYMTSKIDPTTGFADLIKPKYTSVADSLALIEKIDCIRYLESEKMFAFDLDYSKFPRRWQRQEFCSIPRCLMCIQMAERACFTVQGTKRTTVFCLEWWKTAPQEVSWMVNL